MLFNSYSPFSMVKVLYLILFTVAYTGLYAQTLDENQLSEMRWRAIGPTATGGRIVDIEVEPGNTSTIYAASASGGLWKTVNNGTTWKCVFENEATISIGDIAIDPQHVETIWVGTGEANNQRSSYWGDGIYKSEDGGNTWKNCGLGDSHHIGRIVVDPSDSETVYVAALGHLYSHNKARGLYRTRDGGQSWECVLHIDEKTGVVDVVIDPEHPRTLYAATYERLRRAWHFDGAGPGSAIYKSDDGGDNWIRLGGGLPEGEIGRIGLAIYPAEPSIVYASVSNQNEIEVAVDYSSARGYQFFEPLGFRLEPAEGGAVVVTMKKNSRASSMGIRLDDVLVKIAQVDVRDRKVLERMLAGLAPGDRTNLTMLREGEERRFQVTLPMNRKREIGGEIYRSEDQGKTWIKRNKSPVGGNPAYYYGQIRVDPQDSQRLYVLSVGLYVSDDGGESFHSRGARSVHVDHHALWINPENSNHVILGNDGGFHLSYDRTKTWDYVFNLPIAQFYAVWADTQVPYHVYGGTQDNGTHGGPSETRRGSSNRFDWYGVGGGDGFYVQVDPTDNNTIYSESQFGAINRLERKTGKRSYIGPRQSDPKGAPDRYNWNSPILLSNHHPDTLYFAGNKLFKSYNRGDDWLVVSPDLTTQDPARLIGNVPHCTITTIDESRIDRDVLLVGTDDGKVQWTDDGGKHWEDMSDRFPLRPRNWWVSRVVLSRFDTNVAYVSFTGYREDDFRPFVFTTTDRGKTWNSIIADLPISGPVNVIREDARSRDLLYVGTEFGVHVSIDRGASWFPLDNDIPTIAVHDLVLQERERDLVAGTHGRGIYIMDIGPLQELTELKIDSNAHLFTVDDAISWNYKRGISYSGDRKISHQNPPRGALISYFLKEELAEDVEASLIILNGKGKKVRTLKLNRNRGIHRTSFRPGGRYGSRGSAQGRYTVQLKIADDMMSQSFEIKADPQTDIERY